MIYCDLRTGSILKRIVLPVPFFPNDPGILVPYINLSLVSLTVATKSFSMHSLITVDLVFVC